MGVREKEFVPVMEGDWERVGDKVMVGVGDRDDVPDNVLAPELVPLANVEVVEIEDVREKEVVPVTVGDCEKEGV